jgi:hypothetical protein
MTYCKLFRLLIDRHLLMFILRLLIEFVFWTCDVLTLERSRI